MPIDEMGQEAGMSVGQQPAPTTPTAPPPPLPLPGQPGFVGPVLPQAPRGRSRLEGLVNLNRGMFASGIWGKEFNEWILSLPDDPSDPEYNAALQWAKSNARSHLEGRSASLGGKPREPKTTEFKIPAFPEPQLQTGKQPPSEVEPGGQPFLSTTTMIDEREEQRTEYARRRKTEAFEQPVFRGRQITEGEIFEQGQEEDAYLKQFLTEQGIQLTGDDKNLALRSGAYVLMGVEVNQELHAERPVYMYVQDAEFALADLDATTLGNYQKALGLPVTGKTDPDLQKMWNYAVNQARGYAARGQKVTVKELMDIYVSSAAAQKTGRGGGGGGGSGLIGETPEDQAAIDYYRAMMAILGDISGVPDAQA